jgi:hypothetical protein
VATGSGHGRVAPPSTTPGAHRAATDPVEEPGARDPAPQPDPALPAADLFGHKGQRWPAERGRPPNELTAATALLRQLDLPRRGAAAHRHRSRAGGADLLAPNRPTVVSRHDHLIDNHCAWRASRRRFERTVVADGFNISDRSTWTWIRADVPDTPDKGDYAIDPTSTAHFYQFVNGVPFRQSCPLDTFYNPYANPGPVCDHPSNLSDSDYYDWLVKTGWVQDQRTD